MDVSRTTTIPARNFNAISVRTNSQAARPVDHFKAFYRLAKDFAALNLSVFKFFLTCLFWSSYFATIDSKILYQNSLNSTRRDGAEKLALWHGAINLNALPFRDQEKTMTCISGE
ncbi:hypothetical protein G6F57_008193 [Rhizopus arrhizus]|uniref:Uncharacterized protein n=1 Tax=Rhizopus oryzae TaxID=64495 RepID=A0A9P6XQV2_RHIOR|nr:hypothetical protein G6F24_007999 [Rhizopus arrhizus]KAG1418808.1 hypothetical protein G6F58_004905 [Rhizopus delemar]KAG0909844.1 hypothetical protein G6F33_008425 [Rhizopus arrhizus]KAG0940584.1 hypothetical protein G6F30_006641 [Rhizopus arrhizus]KAG0955504.1 hypothetical protein G6F32_002713 [Rhizopus arrhizus]